MESNDKLLLCSDGLHDLVPLDEFGVFFNQNLMTDSLLEKHISRANELGGYDNITALVLELENPINS